MKDVVGDMLEDLVNLVEEAGRLVLTCDRTATLKADGSDVTPADLQSHAFLMEGLRRLKGADVRILSEEGGAPQDMRQGISFVIDPLDGTSNFKNGKRAFSILLSVLQDGVPVLGVAVAPAYGLTVCGGTAVPGSEIRLHHKNGETGYREIRKLSPIENDSTLAIVPKRFLTAQKEEERAVIGRAMEDFQKHAGNDAFLGSGAILGSMLPVFNKRVRYRLYEATQPNQRPGDWDLAAWDAILRGAGGIMTDLSGAALVYGRAKDDFKHQGFICWRKQGEAAAYAALLTQSAGFKGIKP